MGQYLIDNNVISNYFSGLFSEKAMQFVAEIIDQVPVISVITEIEALSWVNPDKSKELIVQSFVKDSQVIALTPLIATQCVTLRRSRKIKTPDAIIAATAMVHNLILVTSDNDFQALDGLKIINPQEL